MKTSVVIVSWDGSRGGRVPKLVASLKKQTLKNFEVIVITRTSPVGKARNEGAKKAKGDIIIYIDDDAVLGNNKVLENLVKTLESNKKIGAVGGSRLLPKKPNKFQKRLQNANPKEVIPIAKETVESDDIGTYCLAIRKKVLQEADWFNEKITSGEDTELRYLLREKGYKTVLVADTWVHHPPRPNMKAFLKQAFWYGNGAAHLKKHGRVRIPDISFLNGYTLIPYAIFRIITIPIEFIFPFLRPLISGKKLTKKQFTYKPLLFLGQYASLMGVIYGFMTTSFRRIE